MTYTSTDKSKRGVIHHRDTLHIHYDLPYYYCEVADHVYGPYTKNDVTNTIVWTCPILDTDIDIKEQLKEYCLRID